MDGQQDQEPVAGGGFDVHARVRAPGSITLTLAGELDHTGVASLQQAMADAWSTHPRSLTVDLRQLRFINARGLGCLLTASRTAQRRATPLVLLVATGLVSRLVMLLGLGDLVAAAPPVLALVPDPVEVGSGAAAGFLALVQLDAALAGTGGDVGATREVIVAQLHQHVRGTGHASVCGASGRRLSPDTTVSGAGAGELAALQLSAREGPSHDVRRHRVPVHVPDLRTDSRWPRLSEAVTRQSTRSMLAFPLVHESQLLGVLTLCSDAPDAFDADARAVAGAMAARAATGLGAAVIREGLAAALRSRDIIGQAKGILMTRYKLPEQHAFDLLSQASQDRNLRVADLADEVARLGDL